MSGFWFALLVSSFLEGEYDPWGRGGNDNLRNEDHRDIDGSKCKDKIIVEEYSEF